MLENILTPKVYGPFIGLLVAYLFYKFLSKLVDKVLKIKENGKKHSNVQYRKEKTIINLIKSIIKYIIAIIFILVILKVNGVDTTGIIASLGIVGGVIGLAFQDTIKNLLASLIIIFDNHYMQGDVVTINGFRGEVIELGFQTTKIKSYNGEVMIVNNSMITSVINHSMYPNVMYLELTMANNISLDELKKIISNVNQKMKKLKEVKKDIELLGIESIDTNKYIYQVMIEVTSESQFKINRVFMEYLKAEYEKLNIKIPPEVIEVKKDINSK